MKFCYTGKYDSSEDNVVKNTHTIIFHISYFLQTIPLNENTTTTGANKPVLSIKNGVLNEGKIYTFSLSVQMEFRQTSRQGLAFLDLAANLPPSGGTCKLWTEKPYVVAMEDKVGVT